MTHFVLILGSLIAGAGVLLIVVPGLVKSWAASMRVTEWLRYLGAVLRFAIAAGLYLAAEHTNFPTALLILAGFSVLSAVVLLFASRNTLQRWLDGMSAWPALLIRALGILSVALGVFLIFAAI